ncbi:MAG: DNA polymerase I [Synergistaceae bacterium]|nr:DNA polymerase I [Synergistaceae bacterium]
MIHYKEVNAIKTFLIVDGHSIAYRSFHAVNAKLTAPDGTPTAMITGFLNILFRVQDIIHPDCNIVVFDAHGKTFRHDLLPTYKHDRKPMADELRIQFPLLQELLRFMGCNVIIRSGVEADDVVASVSKLVHASGYYGVILSSDKDLFQLLDTGVTMIRPVKSGLSGAEIYDKNAFVKEFGFMPSSMSDYLAITGDNSDSVKGITGIGEKGAKKLLAEYSSLEAIYESLPALANGIRSKLESHGLENALWTRENIIKLKDNIYEGEEGQNFLNECMNFSGDIQKAEELAARLGLSKLLKRMGSSAEITTRKINDTGKIIMPDCDIITRDYKNELRINPGNFDTNLRVWDLKTAYYLLHPDKAGNEFANVTANMNPDDIVNMAGRLEAEIRAHESLSAVMNDIDIPLIPVLNKMEDRGVKINPSKFQAVEDELEARIIEIEECITKETGTRINVNSPAQVSWLLFERLAFEPETKTRSRTSYSTSAQVLEHLAERPNGAVPRLILEHRELSKMLTGFVIPLQKAADENGIIHTTFEPAFTGTGRLSSRDPNLQNIPAFGKWADEIKSALIPKEKGNVFVGADYSQIELRVLAYMSGEERLIDAFTHNRDIHTETASWVFDVMPELVTPELRRAAKMINFGLLYGMTSFGLADRLNVSRTEAKDIMNKYFAALPGLKAFLDELIDSAKATGFTRTLFGRIRRVSEIPAKGPALDRTLINSPIQGTAADIARKAMINFESSCSGKLFLQVHDSLVCECSESESQCISESLREIMISSGEKVNHLDVVIKTGRTLADV